MKKYPYIFATIIATLLAIVVWLCTPKEYTAITKVSDEYKEMDLAIGLDDVKAHLKQVLKSDNIGMNDVDIYCKVLKTKDFAKRIAHMNVPGRNISYGEYIEEKDTISAVLDKINYSNKHEILTISFKDRDPQVAAQMLDSVTTLLQEIVTHNRHIIAQAACQNAKEELDSALTKYRIAQKAYMEHEDSNVDVVSQVSKQKGEALSKEVTLAYKQVKNATTQHVRQKALMQRSTLSFATLQSNTTPQDYNIPFIGILLAILIPSLLLVKGFFLYKEKKSFIYHLDWGNLFAPWNITIALWTFVLLCIYLLGDKLYPLTTQFYTCISLWLSLFCITSFITYNLNKQDDKQDNYISAPIYYNKALFYILLAISLVLSPMCVKKMLDIVSAFGSDNLMQSIRLLAVKGEGFGLLEQCFFINKVLFIIAIWKYPEISIWKVLLIFFLLILNSIAVMDKGTLFFIVIVFVFILHEKGKIKTVHMAIGGSFLVFIFFMLTVLRGGTDDEGNYNEQMNLLEFLAIYVFANPVAFGYLNQGVVPQFGANTFYLLYYFLNRYGVGNYVAVDIVQEFTYVPLPTNLYTVMQPFYVDFGSIGVAYFALIYGVFTGWCYAGYRRGNSTMKCLYTYLVMVLVLQFGQEQIFLLPLAFLKICFLIYILTQNRFRLSLYNAKNKALK